MLLRPLSPVRYLIFMDGMLAQSFGARGPQLISIPLGTAVLVVMFCALRRFNKDLTDYKYAAKDLVPAVLVSYCLIFCAATRRWGRSRWPGRRMTALG